MKGSRRVEGRLKVINVGKREEKGEMKKRRVEDWKQEKGGKKREEGRKEGERKEGERKQGRAGGGDEKWEGWRKSGRRRVEIT